MKAKQIKTILFIYIIFCVLSFGVAFLRSGYITICGLTGFRLSSLVGFLVFACLTPVFLNLYIRKLSPFKIILAISLGVGLLDILGRIPNFSRTLTSLPSLLLWGLGIWSGYLYWKSTSVVKKVFSILIPFIFTLWVCFHGYSLWTHKLNFGTYTGRVDKAFIGDYFLIDGSGKNVNLSQFQGRYLLLDFWYKYCGVCYKKMPLVEKLYTQYKGVSDIKIFSVYVCGEGDDISEGDSILRKEGYTFPNFVTYFKSDLLKDLPVMVYPTVAIINPEGKLVYLGNIEGAANQIEKLGFSGVVE